MSISYAPWNQPATIAGQVCLHDGDAELSYGDVARRAEAVAERFAALGVRRGNSVAIMLHKDMIIRGGENVYPKEIESVLAGHDAVLEAAVVGAPHPVYGEVPVAYVVTYPGTWVTTAELTDRCRCDLTKNKIPVAIHLVDRLPRNAVGKIDKPALRKTLSTQSA